MATVEGLFNFDEKLLARDIAGQREDYMFGNNMPKGYGAVGMGFNKMLRGLFNNDNPILKEKALAEEALQMTQQQLGGDMTDPSKMYGVLMKNLNELGASPQSVSQVADKKAEIDANADQASIANQLKLLTINQAANQDKQGNINKFRTFRQKVSKQLTDDLKLDSLTSNKQTVFEISDKITGTDEDARASFNNLVLAEITNVINEKTIEDDFDSNSVLQEALKNVAEKYTWKEGNWNNGTFYGDKGMWVQQTMTNGDTVNKNDTMSPELKDLLERNKTK
jgi:hypothetical protein